MPLLSPPQDESSAPLPGSLDVDVQCRSANPGVRLLRGAMFASLQRIIHGQILLIEGADRFAFGGKSSELKTTIEILDPRFYRLAVFGGSMGAAEAFRRGYWRTNDLINLIRIMVRNESALSSLGGTWKHLLTAAQRVVHFFNRNTRAGSRRNIAAHYDLSNEFFSLFLDETMTYSSGIFPTPDSTLRAASVAKYDRVCRKLRLRPGDRVLEIGTGWGGFAAHAAKNFGCHVTTTTISKEQHAYAAERFRAEGLNDQVTLLRRDYRELQGTFDHVVSIEMIEAVGHEFLGAYFEKCADLLEDNGQMLLQAITIPDQYYDRYRKSVDFIQRYIFPGGCLPSLGAINNAVARHTDLRLMHLEDFGQHYARTLHVWRERFLFHEGKMRQLGKTDEFLRTWDFYFCYCAAAFLENQIGVAQLLLHKPRCQHAALLPSLVGA